MNLNKEYWSERYKEQRTGWDIGEVSTPIKEYIDQIENKELKILIPGAGNAYEAEYLFRKGFKNIYILDFANEPLERFKNRIPDFPEEHILNENFFEITGSFDLILEQTFFCSLPPLRRTDYAIKMHELLKVDGKLVGVLFDMSFAKQGPPFGGDRTEYLTYFSPYFKIVTFENCYNSIPPRKGSELFMILKKTN
jgi:methyl halide transferase